MPPTPSKPYVFMEDEDANAIEDKGGGLWVVNSRLTLFSDQEDSEELKTLCDSVVTSMSSGVTISGSWVKVRQEQLASMRTSPAQTVDGTQGRAAEITYQFLIQESS